MGYPRGKRHLSQSCVVACEGLSILLEDMTRERDGLRDRVIALSETGWYETNVVRVTASRENKAAWHLVLGADGASMGIEPDDVVCAESRLFVAVGTQVIC